MGTIVVRKPQAMRFNAPVGEFSAGVGGAASVLPGTSAAAAKMEVTVEDLSQKEKAQLEASPEHEIADSMPLSLIRPLEARAASGAQVQDGNGGQAAWGIVATRADMSQFDGSGVPVAVLDTGIDPDHPAFQGVNLVQANFTQEADADTDGHGTHCAGTIFGRDVDGTRIGVARGITNAFIAKVIPGGSDDLVNALNWAFNNGARVASMSLGFDFAEMIRRLEQEYGLPQPAAVSIALRNFRANITVLDLLINQFRARALDGGGMLVVAATGNESERGRVAPQQPYTVAASSPAASMGIISVAALAKAQNGLDVAYFSNTNAQVSAPGVDVLSAKAGSGGLTAMDGTSMACPHVAGLAALYWQEAQQQAFGANAEAIAARVVGRADTARLSRGWQRIDVGSGLAIAP